MCVCVCVRVCVCVCARAGMRVCIYIHKRGRAGVSLYPDTRRGRSRANERGSSRTRPTRSTRLPGLLVPTTNVQIIAKKEIQKKWPASPAGQKYTLLPSHTIAPSRPPPHKHSARPPPLPPPTPSPLPLSERPSSSARINDAATPAPPPPARLAGFAETGESQGRAPCGRDGETGYPRTLKHRMKKQQSIYA